MTNLTDFADCLRYVRMTFTIPHHPFAGSLPYSLGGAIRGKIGRVLSDRAARSGGVFHIIYEALFKEDPVHPRLKPFTLYILKKNRAIEVCFSLFGMSCDWHPYLYDVLCEVFRETVRIDKASFPLRAKKHLVQEEYFSFCQDKTRSDVTIELLTPLCLKHKDALSGHFDDFVKNIHIRVQNIAYYHGLDMTETCPDTSGTVLTAQTNVISWTRHSARTPGKTHVMVGYVGTLTFRGPIPDKIQLLLQLGEIIQVGGYTNFGLGKYIICVDS